MEKKLKVTIAQTKEMSEQEILDFYGIDRIDISANSGVSSKLAGNALIYYKNSPVAVRVPLFIRTPSSGDPYVTPPIRRNAIATAVNQGREVTTSDGRRLVVDQIFVPNPVLELIREKANDVISLNISEVNVPETDNSDDYSESDDTPL